MYRFFTDDESVAKPKLPRRNDSSLWGSRGEERDELNVLVRALTGMEEGDRKLLVSMAQGMARRGAKR